MQQDLMWMERAGEFVFDHLKLLGLWLVGKTHCRQEHQKKADNQQNKKNKKK
jgi:hypothetical protein